LAIDKAGVQILLLRLEPVFNQPILNFLCLFAVVPRRFMNRNSSPPCSLK